MSAPENTRRGERKARRDAKHLLKDTRKILNRHGYRIPEAGKVEVLAACGELEKTLADRDHDAIVSSLGRLEEVRERHLAFAKKSTFREYAESIGVAVLIALLLRAFVVEAFKIPSGSMIPTMQVGDHIFVNKFLYGLRIPFTRTKVLEYRAPHRGEVIVFIYPVEPEKDFIKRVVALEGDSIRVEGNQVYVNGRPVSRRVMPGVHRFWDYREGDFKPWHQAAGHLVEEELDGQRYVTLVSGSSAHDYPSDLGCVNGMLRDPSNPRACIVPKGHVFAMGDNRNDSQDSRYWGPVPLANIKGKALVVWWSWGGGDDSGFMGFLNRIRWNRIGQLVH
ncbi:MAG: signal peptidase I [Deltaproteobacteria bacterium]|nr:signal peptidase I [Deltaproteobacteria bacterium]